MKVFGKIMKEDGTERFATSEIFKNFGTDYKCIFVGDAPNESI